MAKTGAERQAAWRKRHMPSDLLKHLKEAQKQVVEAHARIAELEAELVEAIKRAKATRKAPAR